MNREIKFRGKKVDLGGTKDTSFVYGFLSNTEFINDKFGNGHCVDYKTTGQFTGLKDREAKEIYEGDILKCWDNCVVEEWSKYHIGCVVYIGLNFSLKIKDNYLSSFYNSENILVIGNIHENPELLTVNN